MGPSPSSVLFVLASAAALAAQSTTHPGKAPPPAEVVLADARDGAVDLRAFGLGDGGIAARARGVLRQDKDGCTTPGGVRVECRTAGVKLTFPSGRELLFAPDGCLHLRGGEVAGPFPSGAELRLGDGTAVRVALAQGQRERLREVVLVDGGFAVQPWHRGWPAREEPRSGAWAGVRLCCLGDGGDLYRPIALGPLVVLERVLVAEDRQDHAPRERLVVLCSPLMDSLATMRRQHRETDAAVRHAVAAVAAVAERGGEIFPAGAALQRAEHDQLRWLLGGPFELGIDLAGPMAPRLQLFAGRNPAPMIEWTLRAGAAAFLTNPRDDQVEKRWHGNGTRVADAAVDLQAREHLLERAKALAVLRRLRGEPPVR
ncbi:MAG: hypothetical protein WBO45_18555 [Planctomycetota bacterium]